MADFMTRRTQQLFDEAIEKLINMFKAKALLHPQVPLVSAMAVVLPDTCGRLPLEWKPGLRFGVDQTEEGEMRFEVKSAFCDQPAHTFFSITQAECLGLPVVNNYTRQARQVFDRYSNAHGDLYWAYGEIPFGTFAHFITLGWTVTELSIINVERFSMRLVSPDEAKAVELDFDFTVSLRDRQKVKDHIQSLKEHKR